MELDLLNKINTNIINPLIMLLIGVAVIYFLFGVVKYIASADNATERAVGAKHMMWGVVGLFIMVTAFGIMQFVCNVVGCN
ncbi:MAG: hypothetical protein WDZ73_00960 [Candidatus Paceibacterota bacterium]